VVFFIKTGRVPMKSGAHIIVKGIVQGVGYRFFAMRQARAHRLNGWVRNRPNGNVELEVEGEPDLIESFAKELKTGPRFAQVTDVVVTWKEYKDKFSSFDIA
jgi:acylphosphatase